MIVAENTLNMDINRQYNIGLNNQTDKIQKNTSIKNEELNNEKQKGEKVAEISLSGYMKKQAKDKSYEINDAQEQISLYQVADNSLAEMNKKLYRITQLSIQANSDNTTNNDKRAIQDEINQLRLEIQNIGEESTFNNQPVFSNVAAQMNSSTNKQAINNGNNTTSSGNGESKLDVELENILSDLENVDVTTREGATKAINQTLNIMSKLHDTREKYISIQDRVQENMNNDSVVYNADGLRESDIVTELVQNLNSNMLEQSSQAVYVQGNKVNSDVLALLR